MAGSGTRTFYPMYEKEANGHPFEMGMLWGKLSAQMDHNSILLQQIATGVERMPERLAHHLSDGLSPKPSWKDRIETVRVIVPASLIVLLLFTRLLAPDAFLDVIKLLPHIPR